MALLALVVILAFALWIAAAGGAALASPAVARSWIGRFATSHAVNWAEQAWRGSAGIALLVRGPASHWPHAFTVAGWVLVISSLALLIIPLQWHAGYARFWAAKLPLPVVRLAGIAALALAGALAWAAVGP